MVCFSMVASFLEQRTPLEASHILSGHLSARRWQPSRYPAAVEGLFTGGSEGVLLSFSPFVQLTCFLFGPSRNGEFSEVGRGADITG